MAEVPAAREFRFGEFALDPARYRLRRGARSLRLEKRPMELLILLVERRGELVTREEIARHLWGPDVHLEVDHGINTAVRKVRQALHDDSQRPRFVETVVGKGYRFAATVALEGVEPGPSPPPATGPAAAARPPERAVLSGRRFWLLAVAGLVALAAAALPLVRGTTRSRARPRIQSLAVLPLKNLSGDPAQEYFADGMTEAVISRLSMIRGLRVISRTSVMRFKDSALSAPEIARALRVDALVEGSVVREGGHVRVNAQLIRGATDEHFWSEAYDRELEGTLALEADVARSIARRVEVTLTGDESARLVAARHVAPEVYKSYLEGRFVGRGDTRADLEKSIAYFEEASREDPTFAPAYLGLAEAYDRLGTIFFGAPAEEVRPKAIDAARKALELDPNLAEAHVVLADVHQRRWQWVDARTEYEQALELSPNDAAAHLGLGGWLLCQGRMDEALDWTRRGRELDPLGSAGTSIGWILTLARRYDEALRELRSDVEAEPDSANAQWTLGFALIADGKAAEALPMLQRAVSLTDRGPAAVALLGVAEARAGHRADALRLLQELKDRQRRGFVPAGAFLNLNLGLGDREQAFVWLDRAYQEKSNILQFVKSHPLFDPVRADPRFVDVVRRIGLDRPQ